VGRISLDAVCGRPPTRAMANVCNDICVTVRLHYGLVAVGMRDGNKLNLWQRAFGGGEDISNRSAQKRERPSKRRCPTAAQAARTSRLLRLNSLSLVSHYTTPSLKYA